MKPFFSTSLLYVFIVIVLLAISSCSISNYGIYKRNLIHDTNTTTTATNIIPFRLCIGTKDSQYVMLEDILEVKYTCYKEISFNKFNKYIGPKIFRKKCVSPNCANIQIIRFSNRQYDSLTHLGISKLVNNYFINGVSKESYEYGREKLTPNFLIALIILFDNEYKIWDGGAMDDNYHITKFPTNKKMLGKRR